VESAESLISQRMVLPPVETRPVMLLRFTPEVSFETISDVIDSLQNIGIIIVDSEGLNTDEDEDNSIHKSQDKNAEKPEDNHLKPTLSNISTSSNYLFGDDAPQVVLGLSTTQKLLEHEAEMMRLVKPCRTLHRHIPIVMEHFNRASRSDFVNHSPSDDEDYDSLGLFNSADRALLVEAMIEAIPAPSSLQKTNLEVCSHKASLKSQHSLQGRLRAELSEMISQDDDSLKSQHSLQGKLRAELSEMISQDDDQSQLSLIKACFNQDLIDVFCPTHDNQLKCRISRELFSPFTPPPLDAIRNYYGEAIAFYFAWMDHMVKWFIVPGVMGFMVYCYRVFVTKKDVNTCELTPFVGLYTFAWAVLCNKFWERREARLAYRWGTFTREGGTRQLLLKLGKRAGFKGHLHQNPISGKKEIYFSPSKRRLRCLATAIVTLSLLLVAASVMVISMNIQGYVSSDDFPGDDCHPLHYPFFSKLAEPGGIFDAKSSIKGLLPVLLRAAIVFAMNKKYSTIAEWLTEWENHETIVGHQNSLILKRVLFEAFDTFIILFYLACFERDVILLRMELTGAFTVDTIRRVFTECVLPYAMQKGWTKDPIGKHKKDDDIKKDESDGSLRAETDLEKYEQFDDYIEMLIQFGYVTLFASAFPLAAFLAAIANFIEMRSDAWKLCHLHRRPSVIKASGIGMWVLSLKLIAWLSAWSNLLIFVFTSNQMRTWFPHYYADGTDRNGHLVLKANSTADIFFTLWTIEHALILVVFLIRIIPSIPASVYLRFQQHSWYLEKEAVKSRFTSPTRTPADTKKLVFNAIKFATRAGRNMHADRNNHLLRSQSSHCH